MQNCSIYTVNLYYFEQSTFQSLFHLSIYINQVYMIFFF